MSQRLTACSQLESVLFMWIFINFWVKVVAGPAYMSTISLGKLPVAKGQLFSIFPYLLVIGFLMISLPGSFLYVGLSFLVPRPSVSCCWLVLQKQGK